MRSPAVALIVLLSASGAPAVTITGFAVGQVTRNLSEAAPGSFVPYSFSIGEPVALRFTYNFNPDAIHPFFAFDVATGGGYSFGPTLGLLTGSESPDRLVLFGSSGGNLAFVTTLTFTGDTGRFEFVRELPRGSEGFVASLTRTAGPSPGPEPSTLPLDLAGVAVLGLGRMRRRAAARG